MILFINRMFVRKFRIFFKFSRIVRIYFINHSFPERIKIHNECGNVQLHKSNESTSIAENNEKIRRTTNDFVKQNAFYFQCRYPASHRTQLRFMPQITSEQSHLFPNLSSASPPHFIMNTTTATNGRIGEVRVYTDLTDMLGKTMWQLIPNNSNGNNGLQSD